MDNSLSYKIFPLLLLHFMSLLSSSSLSYAAYTLPPHYFINCGSASAVKVYGLQTFDGDAKSGILTAGKTSPVEDSTLTNISELYQTARIFKNPSVYEFDIVEDGIYVVRFHFYTLTALGNLPDARFSVEASIFRILSNFSVQNSNVSDFPLIEEFLLQIPTGKLKIRFVPDDAENSFAFVNAMEVFMAPPYSVGDSSSVLHLIHRINVGGENVGRNSDKLFRNWITDDSYLLSKEIAMNSDPYRDNIYYELQDYREFVAPTSVYNTAKEVSIRNDSSGVNSSKIFWRFDVKTGANHLVRLHFCDIVSSTTNEFLRFILFINAYSAEVYPYDHGFRTASAFYIDHEVDSDGSGVLNISIRPENGSSPPTAFLNGIEIFEIVNELGSKSGGTKRGLLLIVGSCVGGSILVAICLALSYFCLKKKAVKPAADQFTNHPVLPRFFGAPISKTKTTDKTVSSSSHELNLGLKVSLSEIMHATKNFDSKMIIGKGGFGKVYEGIWRNGSKVAVKRSEAGNGQGLPEFQTEIIVLSNIRHHHLVSLIGYCDEGDEMILVYEFMEKGTLRDHLYVVDAEKGGSTSKSELSWEQRLEICIGAAKGIHYLHTGSSGAIIHRDIKSTNILLDADYVAKVADFGLSKSGPRDDQTHVSTAVKGSFGYFDPDYFRCLQLTQKSDVYSFGVVLLEVVCARAVIDPREQISLAELGLSMQKKGQLETIVDPFLVGKINPNSLRKFGETVAKCLEENGADRPNMVDVLWDLEYCSQLQKNPIPTKPYQDSTTDVALGIQMNVLQRLPSHTISIEIDDSCSFSDATPSGGLN